jgi:hypothetical protein
MLNLQFYQNSFCPPGIQRIEQIHNKLEACHNFIQWLFPMMDEDSAFNKHSMRLLQRESFTIQENMVCSIRVLGSFEMMLDFLGFRLKHDDWTIVPSCRSRIQFINSSPHNFLRITRMLKSMDHLGLQWLRLSFLKALKEQVLYGELFRAKYSYDFYWSKFVDIETYSLKGTHCNLKQFLELSDDQTIPILTKVILESRCCFHASRLLIERVQEDCFFDKECMWLILGVLNGAFVVLNCKHGDVKVAPHDMFTFVYSVEGKELSSFEYVGLYLWDRVEDCTFSEVEHAIFNSYMCKQTQLKCVFFIK